MKITAYVLSCPEREQTRNQTLANLQATDWNEAPVVQIDQAASDQGQERQEQTAWRLLKRAAADGSHFVLFLEDDLQFNQHLRHNLINWYPLKRVQPGEHFFGSLYNPGVYELERNDGLAFFVADPQCVYGSQAFILSSVTARHISDHWEEVVGMQDIRMSRLAARICPIYYHTPSLVQHVGFVSAWGGPYHRATDFLADWRAGGPRATTVAFQADPSLLTFPILDQMRRIEGWLDEAEAELLIATTVEAADLTPDGQATSIVEVGSYCGRSTIVLGLTLKGLGLHTGRVHAIDPHEGRTSSLDQGIMQLPPTFDHFCKNIRETSVTDIVEPIRAHSVEVAWYKPIDLLFIDGLHDYSSVSADFHHFANWLRPGGSVAFHDYADHFFGVKQFVDELAGLDQYQLVGQAKSLVVLRKLW